jgi:hypothetical protein
VSYASWARSIVLGGPPGWSDAPCQLRRRPLGARIKLRPARRSGRKRSCFPAGGQASSVVSCGGKGKPCGIGGGDFVLQVDDLALSICDANHVNYATKQPQMDTDEHRWGEANGIISVLRPSFCASPGRRRGSSAPGRGFFGAWRRLAGIADLLPTHLLQMRPAGNAAALLHPSAGLCEVSVSICG